MKFIHWSFLLLVILASCKKDTPNDPGGSNTLISKISYYYSPNPSLAPTTVTINYGAGQRIDMISQTYPESPSYGSWKFTYNTNGSIANVKGEGVDWFTKQNYVFYYSTTGRLDSIRLSDKAYDGDSVHYTHAYQYDANNHIRSSYTYVLNTSIVLNFKAGDTLTKVQFFRSADLDSVRYTNYAYFQPNVPPSPVTNYVHFDKTPASDLQSMDPALLFWFAIRSNAYAPGNVVNPFWYQYINPDIRMVRGGSFSDNIGSSWTYDFSMSKDADGNVTRLSYRSSGEEHKDSINLFYTQIPK